MFLGTGCGDSNGGNGGTGGSSGSDGTAGMGGADGSDGSSVPTDRLFVGTVALPDATSGIAVVVIHGAGLPATVDMRLVTAGQMIDLTGTLTAGNNGNILRASGGGWSFNGGLLGPQVGGELTTPDAAADKGCLAAQRGAPADVVRYCGTFVSTAGTPPNSSWTVQVAGASAFGGTRWRLRGLGFGQRDHARYPEHHGDGDPIHRLRFGNRDVRRNGGWKLEHDDGELRHGGG